MSSWINEATVPNHNGNGFPHINDPTSVAGAMMDPSAFMANPAQFNPQFANPQQMVALQNGQMRNASPSFANPLYQTNSVIPSKRPRPREDGMGQSPRQAPGLLPTSRAETPQQSPFAGFQQGTVPQQPSSQPSPYPHLQPNGSSNATPSPIMANQMRPGSVPQRVSTTSPHPFSPAVQQFSQASPIASDHGSTPQPNPYMQQGNFPPGFNPQFTPTQSPARPSLSPNPMAGQIMSQQMPQMPQQMGQIPQHMGQMPGQLGQMQSQMGQMGQMGQVGQIGQMPQIGQLGQIGQMQGQMPGQMGQMQGQMGQMPGQMGQMQGQIAGQMPGQMGQMQGQIAGQMPGQIPNQMFAPQQMPQPRNALEHQKLMYQMQVQLSRNNMQMQQMPAQVQAQAAHAQAQAQARSMMTARQGMPNGQMPPNAMRPQQGMPQQQAMGRVQNMDQLMKHLTSFMNSKQLPLEINPTVDGRPVNLMLLFQAVSRLHGYRNVQGNGWGQVSQVLGFQPQHSPTAPQQLKAIYERNLLKFEETWTTPQNRARMQQGMQPQGMPSMANIQQGTPTKGILQGQMQPGQMVQPGQQAHAQQGQVQTPIKPNLIQQPNVNGFSTPQPPNAQPQGGIPPGHTRNSLSRSVQATTAGDEFPIASPAKSRKSGSVSLPGTTRPEGLAEVGMRFPPPHDGDPEEYTLTVRGLTTYGGVDIQSANRFGTELERWRPDVPPVEELGNIDIHALTKSIQCGIHGEVRVALDTLATVTASLKPEYHIDLRRCDDLMETLIECAEDQIEALAENTVQVSDEIVVNTFEDVTRACNLENKAVRSVPAFGSPDYELDRAVDRLICVTTILRNLSFITDNQELLAEDTVIKFLCVVVRYLGTRNMLLRTQANTLDFMKDVIVLLSNVAGKVEIPGREQALCLLQFLLAFAPSPSPTYYDDRLFFTLYDPTLHPYLPHAVDALAKLFARDEPNRTHYKTILIADSIAASSTPYELLTRTFGLAIAVIPDQTRDLRPSNLPPLTEVRKASLMQGLLAADILASLAPSYDSGVTRAWLASGNGFAQNIFILMRQLCNQFEVMCQRSGAAQTRGQNKKDPELVYIASMAVSMLKRLCEKARDPNGPAGEEDIPANAVPSKPNILRALSMTAPDWTEKGLLADLLAFASLAE